MGLDKLMEENREKELRAIYRFIATASTEELASIIAEMHCIHDNMLVFNRKHKSLDRVELIGVNGECIQLNVKE